MKKLRMFILMLCLFVPLAISGCENKNKATLSTPVICEIRGGTIIFDPVDDADYYTISINDYTFSLNAKQSNKVEIIDNKINFDASNIFVVGNSYSVKIKANASNKNSSKYSTTYSYKHSGNIEKPENLQINGTVLTWDTTENASFYVVKIITPNDTVLFDKQGNLLDIQDSESIAKADLAEYSFNTNRFDFSSLLATAGNYQFYVCAVLSADTNYIQTSYSTTTPYSHYITLETPTNGKIKQVGNALHILTAIDENANAIEIECNNQTKTAEINGAEQSITLINDNFLDINLNLFFNGLFNENELSFEDLSQLAVRIKSIYLSNSIENNYFINSEFSDYVYFDNLTTISTPTISISQDETNNCFVASWSCQDASLVSEYTLLVCTENEVKKYTIDKNINNKLIFDDFIAVAIQAKGVGNFQNSALSEFVSNPKLTKTSTELNFNSTNSTINWNKVDNAYYIVEFNEEFYVVSENSFNVDTNKINNKDYSINVTTIQPEHKHKTNKLNLTFSKTLSTPYIGYNQGFVSANLYELTFTKVDNAIGYYIYLKTKNATEYEKIDILYTTTTIDLTKYICSEGNYSDYQVKIQAVADNNSLYESSELSRAIEVSHIQVLEKPAFYKLNNISLPVSKQISGNSTKYVLKFYGVEDAGSYEVLINYNKINVPAKSNFYTGLYEIDISNYLIAANNYEIKVRAIPAVNAINIQASEYNLTNYALTKQLATVSNIKVSENDGVYTLSFDPIDNAFSYRIRVVKENDSNYVNYLNELGLTNSFEVTQAVDISNYVKEKGNYYFYVTALAPKQNSYYADASESLTYGYVSKKTTLEIPKDLTYSNLSKNSFILNWVGDENADYYLIKIVNPNNIAYEFKVHNDTSAEINKYITIQGTYNFSVYSMINPLSENAKEFTSSSAGNYSFRYIYQSQKDFERYSVYSYGEYYDFLVEDATSLKNLLWYHYLYEIDNTTNLSLMLKRNVKESGATETIREAILRIADEAHNSLYYKFNNDAEWLNLVSNSGSSDNVLFTYLCKKLIEIYPEYNILEGFTLSHASNSQIFELYYKNALNVEKTNSTATTYTNTNYGNDYQYIDLYSRKSATGAFNIDAREEEFVTTTEQLLHAVQHNKKPNFVGESGTAELVYSNAKLVLSAIISNNMSETEKVEAIFNWLSSSFDITYYNDDGAISISGSIEEKNETSLRNYGLSKLYYLEGIFENISMQPNGDIVIGSKYATSKSYSKAFALLCGIEGIECVVVNGYYETAIHGTDTKVNHSWNKVNLDTSINFEGKMWYSVDLTFSDNRIYFSDLRKGYGISSHTYFLTTDSFAELNLGVKDLNYIISNTYKTSKTCKTSYDYYANSSFGLTYTDISNTILDFESETTEISNFIYSYEFNANTNYQKYAKTTGYGPLQAYLLNTAIATRFNLNKNSSNRSVFEFRFKWSDNGNSNVLDIVQLNDVFNFAKNEYSLKLDLINDINGTVYTVEDSNTETTTVIYIVEKIA